MLSPQLLDGVDGAERDFTNKKVTQQLLIFIQLPNYSDKEDLRKIYILLIILQSVKSDR